MSMRCPAGHEMVVTSRWKFDHEPTDSPRDTESLHVFEAMGIELGAEVTNWYCKTCDMLIADFDNDLVDADEASVDAP